MIDAITGGAEAVKSINRDLAVVARETGCAMAVGSQYGAVRKGLYADTYQVVRRENPKGVVFANVSALATPEEARRAVDMVEAQALEIHLNSAQELAMEEGDRDFSRWLEQIAAICSQSEVPVIVKETGCGMAREEARRLLDCGVSILDTGGAAGPISRPSKAAAIRKGTGNCPSGAFPRRCPFWKPWKPKAGRTESSLPAESGRPWMCSGPGAGSQCSGDGWKYPASCPGRRDLLAIQRIRQLLEAVKDFYTLTGCTRGTELRQVRYYFTGDLAAAVRSFLRGKRI